jgi:Na+-driven multidrug efflux pump
VPPMIISLIMTWGITMPLAYFLPQTTDLGVNGIRWAMVAGMVSGAVAFLLYFRTGRWKRKRV